MKFTDFEYKRLDIGEYEAKFETWLEKFENAPTFEKQDEAFEAITQIRKEFDSMCYLCHIRHTIDMKDQFYEEENSFFDKNLPTNNHLVSRFYKLLIHSKFRAQLEEQWGKQLFVIAELSLKTFKSTILEDLQLENKLRSEYTKIKATAKIHFQGKEYNLSSIQPFEMSPDREVRKAANKTKWKFYAEHQNRLENIFDRMVKARHQIATKLGYKNFIETGYARMLRSDYSPEMVKKFRQQVLEHVVPLATELRKRQANRINIDKLLHYDEAFHFASGNPKPLGKSAWILDQAKEMYKELSNETKVFIDFMTANNLVDLEAKPGKAPGGYCSFINKYKSPFIFSNFNGTSRDIVVLTHEAGHAFQVFSSRDMGINEYNWPTFEACEIHSMSMEFFTWPWMNRFFGKDVEKFKFAHLADSVLFLPYGVAVDEFQHFVYENPAATTKERNTAWRNIEKKYLPHRIYEDNEFLENGGSWQQQRHIFNSPFYYIDYTLAQICAFQFLIKDQKDHKDAWSDYVRLCQAGGSQSFLKLVDLAKLKSPFEDNCVEETINEIRKQLDLVDDSGF